MGVRNDAVFGAVVKGGNLDPLMAPTNEGPPGSAGWTPMPVIEEDGAARYYKIVDWVGGSGTKPATGYLGTSGVTDKAHASNLNAAKRFGIFSATTNASGVATVLFGFTPALAAPPSIAIFPPVPLVLGGALKAEEVAASRTATQVQIKVTQQSLLGAITNLLGATVAVLAIEQ
jgi:hypothetical protein